jgi:hypothetical protein
MERRKPVFTFNVKLISVRHTRSNFVDIKKLMLNTKVQKPTPGLAPFAFFQRSLPWLCSLNRSLLFASFPPLHHNPLPAKNITMMEMSSNLSDDTENNLPLIIAPNNNNSSGNNNNPQLRARNGAASSDIHRRHHHHSSDDPHTELTATTIVRNNSKYTKRETRSTRRLLRYNHRFLSFIVLPILSCILGFLWVLHSLDYDTNVHHHLRRDDEAASTASAAGGHDINRQPHERRYIQGDGYNTAGGKDQKKHNGISTLESKPQREIDNE